MDAKPVHYRVVPEEALDRARKGGARAPMETPGGLGCTQLPSGALFLLFLVRVAL